MQLTDLISFPPSGECSPNSVRAPQHPPADLDPQTDLQSPRRWTWRMDALQHERTSSLQDISSFKDVCTRITTLRTRAVTAPRVFFSHSYYLPLRNRTALPKSLPQRNPKPPPAKKTPTPNPPKNAPASQVSLVVDLIPTRVITTPPIPKFPRSRTKPTPVFCSVLFPDTAKCGSASRPRRALAHSRLYPAPPRSLNILPVSRVHTLSSPCTTVPWEAVGCGSMLATLGW